MTRVTFLSNGLGLGNSTRCHAVIQQLHDRGCEIDVLTMGRGVDYFRASPEVARVVPLAAFHYGSSRGSVSARATFAQLGMLLRTHLRNEALIAHHLEARRPNVVVSDSVYSVQSVRRLRVPLVALNNSDVTLRSFCDATAVPAGIRGHFYGIEAPDFAFHRAVPERVVSPTLDTSLSEACGRFRRVPPIVRRGFEGFARTRRPERVVVMPSGSELGMRVRIRRPDTGVQIDVIGRSAPVGETEPSNVAFLGTLTDPLARLSNADLAVVNAGFSAISEMACLQIPMVVVPVRGHAEQWLNAKTVESLGIGRVATEDTWESTMREMLANLDPYRAACRRLRFRESGATRAADEILDVAQRRSA